ncbi:phage head-tail joining protein [Thermithiobacillus plumbiphilus]|uniref:GpW protein n=1 Tax=Thermithiobacillus plumbiphilus TaxID=1729899 RepID=A0ABU9D946_9PROT
MAYTAADREALERALARGERRVTFGDKTVEYRSVDELRGALREVDAALAREAGRPKLRQIRVTTGKGL